MIHPHGHCLIGRHVLTAACNVFARFGTGSLSVSLRMKMSQPHVWPSLHRSALLFAPHARSARHCSGPARCAARAALCALSHLSTSSCVCGPRPAESEDWEGFAVGCCCCCCGCGWLWLCAPIALLCAPPPPAFVPAGSIPLTTKCWTSGSVTSGRCVCTAGSTPVTNTSQSAPNPNVCVSVGSTR